jgi:hypothetical protein
MIKKIKILWKQYRCEHFWRPGIKSGNKPVKVCDYCEKEVKLTTAEFYAQFGRMPYL